MSVDVAEKQHILAIDMPQAKMVWQLLRLTGMERMSDIYHIHCQLLCKKTNINPYDYVGKAVSCCLQTFTKNKKRYIHGYINKLTPSQIEYNGKQQYNITIVPRLWWLTQDKDSRIFQNKTIPEVIQEVLKSHGIQPIDTTGITAVYAKKEYIVQNQESSYHFLLRLMADAGIFYYFRHDKSQHTLVLGDGISAYVKNPDAILVTNDKQRQDHIYNWQRDSDYQLANTEKLAYDFKNSAEFLHSQQIKQANNKLLIREYPNYYENNKEGEELVALQQQVINNQMDLIVQKSNNAELHPGMQINIANHSEDQLQEAQYLVTSLCHDAVDNSYLTSQKTAKENHSSSQYYRNQLTCIPAEKIFRTAKIYNVPPMYSAQTAKVVASAGEAMQTDKYGRVKVYFHWDRHQKPNANSSRWMRVAQAWAGKDHAMQFIPRSNHEVVVCHHHGNPDNPFIGGAVYNGSNKLPYATPDEAYKGGIKTKTLASKDPASFNELQFNDKPQAEEIHIQAQKNQTTRVGKAITETIGNNLSQTLKQGDQDIEAKEKVLIKANQIQLRVGGSEVILSSSAIAVKAMQVQLNGVGSGAAQPAARKGDMHKCPKKTSATPHKGGPILAGSANVLMNGKPAARLSDPAHCRHGKDQISKGAATVTINGKLAAKLNHKTKHGGVIVAGSQNIIIGDTGSGVALPPLPEHTHWVAHQLRYQDKKQTPIKDMPFTLYDSLGIKHSGQTDDLGYAKITSLPPGEVQGYYGNPKQTAKKLQLQRQQLKQYLDELLQQARAAGKQQEVKLAKERKIHQSAERAWLVVKNMAIGAGHALEAVVKAPFQLIAYSAKVQAVMQQGQVASMQGDQAGINEATAQMVQIGNQTYGPIIAAYKEARLVLTDAPTKKIFEDAAIKLLQQTSNQQKADVIASAVGSLLPAMVIFIITKNPDAFAKAFGFVPKGFAKISALLERMDRTIKRLREERFFAGSTGGKIQSWVKEPLAYDVSKWKEYGLPSDGYFVRTIPKDLALELKEGKQIEFGGRAIAGFPKGAGFIGAAEDLESFKTASSVKNALDLNYCPDYLLEFQLKSPDGLQNLLEFDDPLFIQGGLTKDGYREYNFPGINSANILNWSIRSLAK